MGLDRSLSQKRLRTSERCRWIETPSDVAERCWGGSLQFRNVGLSHQGVCGMMFGQITTILSHWFKKRRSLAFGISATGSSLGETIIPIVSSQLVYLIGCVKSIWINELYRRGFSRFKWTMRIVALIAFVMLAIANLTR